jgi:hypothetical protein
MLKNFLNYCKYSGVWVNFAANPYHWRFSFDLHNPDEMDPKMHSVFISVGPLSVRAVLDDGTW